MQRFASHALALLVSLAMALGCGGSDGPPDGGGGSLVMQSNYRLSCRIEPLVLDLPIELSFALDRPYVDGGSAELTFSATVVFSEPSASALIAAGVAEIDIVSMRIAASVLGAAPGEVSTTLAAAPIDDFDLRSDPDDNGAPGPHRLDLEAVTLTSTAAQGVSEVEFSFLLDGISLVLGDFEVPTECEGPTLVGPTARYPVEPRT